MEHGHSQQMNHLEMVDSPANELSDYLRVLSPSVINDPLAATFQRYQPWFNYQ